MNKTYEISCFCSKTNTDSVAVVKSDSVKNAVSLLDRKIFPTINSVYCVEDDMLVNPGEKK